MIKELNLHQYFLFISNNFRVDARNKIPVTKSAFMVLKSTEMDIWKLILVAFALALAFGLAEGFDYHESELASEESLWDLYERWRSHYTVSRDLQEKQKRFNVFKENLKHIHKMNRMDKPYKLKLNKFADMTNHEFMSTKSSKVSHYRMLHGPRRMTDFRHEKTDSLPASIDWRKKGAVAGIKDQGKCGKDPFIPSIVPRISTLNLCINLTIVASLLKYL